VKHQREVGQSGTAADSPSEAFLDLVRRPRRELEETLLRGRMPELAQLSGWEFRGMNTPPWARAVRIRKFIKGFEQRERGQVFGYNRPARQNRDDEPWLAEGRPFGWYRVTPVDATDRDNAYLHAALLDYGRGGNRPWDPSRGLRDYLVQVDGAGTDLYLGKACYALGPARVAVSFFVLERLRQIESSW
jgi:hypothetical protein